MVIKLLLLFLIFFFIFLIIFQIIERNRNIIEGIDETTTPTYKEYAADPLILGQQNAGNINYLKSQTDDIPSFKKKITDLTTRVDNLEQQLAALGEQQNKAVQDMIGTQDPGITGLN
jgi:hypothetical protein